MDLLIQSLSSSTSIIIFIIELGLGFALGYLSVKIFKYLLALIGIFVVGVLLNVWQAPQTGSGLNNQLMQLGLTWNQVSPVIMSFIYMLGLTTVLPTTIGFVLGLVVAMLK